MPAVKITRSIEELKASNPDFALERAAFCAAIQENGELLRLENDSPGSFLDQISNAQIAWVDYWAEDLDKEAGGIAQSLGFSTGLVATLLHNPLAGYEDF